MQRPGSREGCCVSGGRGEVEGLGVCLLTNGGPAASAKGHMGWPHTFSPSPKARGEVLYNKTHDRPSQLNSKKNLKFIWPRSGFSAKLSKINCRTGFWFTATILTFVLTLTNEKHLCLCLCGWSKSVLCVKISTCCCSFVSACSIKGKKHANLLTAGVCCMHVSCMLCILCECVRVVHQPLCTLGTWCCLRAGGWPERVKADNQGEFHDAHTSCSLKFY